jgi:FAD/FMN-containing dehydrogenase
MVRSLLVQSLGFRNCHRQFGKRDCLSLRPRFSSSAGFRSPSDNDVIFFRSILSDTRVVQDEDTLRVRNTDWTKQFQGRSKILLQPSTSGQVAEILQYCQREKLAVVPQAGRTGLVGGSIPLEEEIILSTEKLNLIHDLNAYTGILRCQAGCILADLQTYCADRDHLVPVDLGSKGSCQIGGNLSTNAGGQYYYRYGSLAANVLGLEVVLPDGRILNLNYQHSNLKDNTGYKLHQLFLGAEGTLGVVTGVAMLCPRMPRSRQAVFLACDRYEDVLQVLQTAKSELGEILAALEWMDQKAVELVSNNHTIPLLASDGAIYNNYLLIETHGSCPDHDQEKMEKFLELAMDKGHVVDGVLAQDLSQIESFWNIRESANPAVAATGYGYKYDVSLPLPEFVHFIDEMRSRLQGLNTLNANWGHIVDGNLHFNVTTPGLFQVDESVSDRLQPYLFESVLRRGGSISAEHGLGQTKNSYLKIVHDADCLIAMQKIKYAFDPVGILNPHKFLPRQ